MIGALGGGAWATGWVILINALTLRRRDLPQLEHMDPALLHSPEPVARAPRACSARASATSAASPT